MTHDSVPMSWGDQVAVHRVDGIPYRMYEPRLRRVGHLLDYARRWTDTAHAVQADSTLTFGDLAAAVWHKAGELARLGVKPGDRIFVLGWNCPEWIVNLWAAWRAGAVPVLGNAWWSAPEILGALQALEPVLVLADDRCATKVPAGWRIAPWATESGSGSAGAAAGHDRSDEDEDENEPAVILFTSGSAGPPKAVVLSHRSLIAGLHSLLVITRRLPQNLTDSPHGVALHTGPLFHVGGVQTLLRAVVVGETLIFPSGRFHPVAAMDLIERYKVTRWSAVPTMVTRLLDRYQDLAFDLSSLRSVTVGGAPIHPALLRRIQAELPMIQARTATGYGLTENGGQATAASGRDTQERPGSSGRPLPCAEIRISAADDGRDGEVLVRSPTQMIGYYGETTSPIDNDGWLHTGDCGHLDDGGYLWITGRVKDLIIRGGENIAPASVERALTDLPGVIDAGVFGMPHDDLGEEVAAVVVVDDSFLEQPDLAERFTEQLKKRIASFAVPSRWRFQSKPLPLLESGKVDKIALAKEGDVASSV
jgi:acyl-CoA synthetase (AMP-forming)/AMP-acid ligase II